MTNHERDSEKTESHKHKRDESSEHLSRFANSLSVEKNKKVSSPDSLPKIELVKSSKFDNKSGATRTVLENGVEVTEYPGGGKTTKTVDKDGNSNFEIESRGRPNRQATIDKDGAVTSYSDGNGNLYNSQLVAGDKDATKQKRVWTITNKDGTTNFDGTVGGDNTGSIVVRDNNKTGNDYAERHLNNGTVIRSDRDNCDRTVKTADGLTIENISEIKVKTVYVQGDGLQMPIAFEVKDSQPTLMAKTLTYPENRGSVNLQYDKDGNITAATRTVDGVSESLNGTVKETNGQVEISNGEGNFIITNNGVKIKVDPLDRQLEPDSFLPPTDPESSPSIQESPPGVDLGANIKEAEGHKTIHLTTEPYVFQEIQKYRWFYNKVKPGADWDYKVKGMQYEDFGNFNYGATAAAAGIPLEIALKEAGKVQTVKKREWGEPGNYTTEPGTGSYGDDPRDQLKIREGYAYYLKQKAERELQAKAAA